MGETSTQSLPATPVLVDSEVKPYLVADMARLSDRLLELLHTQIATASLPVEKIQLSLKSSPEDDWNEVVYRVWVDSSEEKAMAFWESLGSAITGWRANLPLPSQEILDDVGVFVECE